MDVKLEDGRIIRNVPANTTKRQLLEKLERNQQLSESNKKQLDSLRSKPDSGSDTARNIGLGARSAIQGITTPVTFIPDIITSGISAATDVEIPTLSSMVSETLTNIGLPEPATEGERVASAVMEGATGGAAAGRAAKGASNVILRKLGSSPKADAVIGAGAGGAAQIAEEEGAGPLAQIGAGLIGGGVAGGLAGKAGQLIRGSKADAPDILSDVAESGIDEPQAFSNVRDVVVNQARKEEKKIKNLFELAKAKGENSFIEAGDLKKLSSDLSDNIRKVIDMDGKQFLDSTSKTIDDLAKSENIANTINELQSFRRQASNVVLKRKSGDEGARVVLEKIDNFLDKVDIKGDQEAASLWKNAIKSRREFGKRFQDPAKIAKAIDEENTVDTVEQLFLGTGPVSSKKDAARTYQEVLKAVPKEKRQETAFALRQSVLNRMIKNAAQRADAEEGISASNLSNSIRNLRRNNSSLWNKFPDEEKKILNKLEVELRKTSKGGPLNKAADALTKILSRSIRSNIEVPRTIKPKTIVTVDDLIEFTSNRSFKELSKDLPERAISTSVVPASEATRQRRE